MLYSVLVLTPAKLYLLLIITLSLGMTATIASTISSFITVFRKLDGSQLVNLVHADIFYAYSGSSVSVQAVIHFLFEERAM